jgi:hypothetical protein
LPISVVHHFYALQSSIHVLTNNISYTYGGGDGRDGARTLVAIALYADKYYYLHLHVFIYIIYDRTPTVRLFFYFHYLILVYYSSV